MVKAYRLSPEFLPSILILLWYWEYFGWGHLYGLDYVEVGHPTERACLEGLASRRRHPWEEDTSCYDRNRNWTEYLNCLRCYHDELVKGWHEVLKKCKLQCTTLQKLSKCEVKAWLCWNLMILLPPLLRFCVKSNFRYSELWKLLKFTKIQTSEPLKLSKLTFLDRLNSPKFDCSKIRVVVKSSNFNKVKP